MRREDTENILEQILGNVQWNRWGLWWCGHKDFQGQPTCQAWFEKVIDQETCKECASIHGSY